MVLNMLQLDTKLGEIRGFRPIFVRGHFQEIGTAVLHLGLKPHYVEKFWECRLMDVRKSDLTDKETCAKQEIVFAELVI